MSALDTLCERYAWALEHWPGVKAPAVEDAYEGDYSTGSSRYKLQFIPGFRSKYGKMGVSRKGYGAGVRASIVNASIQSAILR